MDTNISKAMMMVGGVVISIIIISVLTLFIRKIVPFQQQFEDIEALEQTAEFNKQYQVYNKNLMLGIDIISVINKAYSNNRAYIEAYGYSNDIRDNYLIDIQLFGKSGNDIELGQTLDIKLTKLKIDSITGKQKIEEVDVKVVELEDISKSDLKKLIGLSSTDTLLDEWPNKDLTNGVSLIDETRNTIILGDTKKAELYVNRDIYDIIIENTELKKTFKNTNDSTKEDWTNATYETYAYNLKTKKFKCIGVENSPDSGRIIKMIFQEI